MRCTLGTAARMVAWAVATALHAAIFGAFTLGWLWVRVGVAGPPVVLAYWAATGNRCHLSALERKLHPRGYALCGRIRWHSKAYVLACMGASCVHRTLFV